VTLWAYYALRAALDRLPRRRYVPTRPYRGPWAAPDGWMWAAEADRDALEIDAVPRCGTG